MRARFLHPPRTGGTSIVEAWRLRGTPEYQGHSTPNAPHPFGDPEVTYCTIRNPWDRAVSVYSWALEPPRPCTFSQWVRFGFRVPGFTHITVVDGMPVLAPCWEWAQHADHIVRFEHRTEDLTALAKILGRVVPTKHELPSVREPYPAYYDDATRQIVADHFAEDISRFGYTFGE